MQTPTPSSTSPKPASPDSDEARRARRRVSAEARKRIANACLACKNRKQKCDGAKPCNICRRRGAECVYVEQPPRPTKRHKKNPNLETSDTPGAWGSGLPDAEGSSVSGELESKNLEAVPEEEEGDDGHQHAHNDEEDERVEAPVDHKTRMLSDPSGRLLYIGETGSLSFLARVRKVVKDTLGPSSFTLDSAQNSIADRTLIPRVEQLGEAPSAAIPNSHSLPELVKLFFQNANAVHYVLDRRELDQIVASVSSGGRGPSVTGSTSRDVAILNAVCAIGTFFMRQPQLSAESGVRYFTTARALQEDFFETADFWSVRLLLLLALYMHYAAKRNASWMYIGLAIRVAVSLGLHRTTGMAEQHSDVMDEDIIQQRRRRFVFWTLYSMDRFTGCSLGRPFAIEDNCCTDPIFSDEELSDDFLINNSCYPNQPETIHHIHRAAAKVRLQVIIGHITRLVYQKRTISRDVAEHLSEKLKTWWKSIPQCASLNNGTEPAIVELHMTYLHAVTLLTRPFLQRVVEDSIAEGQRPSNCKCNRNSNSNSNENGKYDARANVRRKMLRYAGACVLVSERTVALAYRMRKQGNFCRNDATLIYHLFTAGLVLLFSALPQVACPRLDHTPDGSPPIDLPARSQPIVSLLGECAAIETCTAKRYHSILSQFATALAEGKERLLKFYQVEHPAASHPTNRLMEPDLLDELQAVGTEYFAGSRLASEEPTSRESVAAHALVAVATEDLGAMPPYFMAMQEGGDGGMYGLNEFSNFFGWGGDTGSGTWSESPPAPWEFSWDGPQSEFFVSAHEQAGMS